jgi:hypothetical protein
MTLCSRPCDSLPPMTTHRIPHNLLVVGTTISHAVMIGGAIALYLAGKIDATAFVAIMAAFGGAWSGVAGALISTRQATPSTAPGGTDPAPGVSAAPVDQAGATVGHA